MKKWLLPLVTLLAAILLGLVGKLYAADWLGKEVNLATVPIAYETKAASENHNMKLSYKMSRLPPDLWKGDQRLPSPGDPIYTVLRPNSEGLYEPMAAYPSLVKVRTNEVIVKGTLEAYHEDQSLSVRYGIERYYVPKASSRRIDHASDHYVVTMKVAPWGQSVITDVHTKN